MSKQKVYTADIFGMHANSIKDDVELFQYDHPTATIQHVTTDGCLTNNGYEGYILIIYTEETNHDKTD